MRRRAGLTTQGNVVGVTMLALVLGGCASAPIAANLPPQPTGLQVLGTGPHVTMARVHLSASEAFSIPVAKCQEATVFVESGAVIASREAVHHGDRLDQPARPVWARHGDVFRFSRLRAPLVAASRGDTRLFVVIARAPHAPFKGEGKDRMRPPCQTVGPLLPQIAQTGTSGPFEHAGGRLRVMVYRDDGHASFGTLDGDPTLAVPEHLHEGSTEVLYFRDGSGVMRIGGQSIRIEPGVFVRVPANTLHSFQPDGTRPVFAYQVYAGPGPEQRFKK